MQKAQEQSAICLNIYVSQATVPSIKKLACPLTHKDMQNILYIPQSVCQFDLWLNEYNIGLMDTVLICLPLFKYYLLLLTLSIIAGTFDQILHFLIHQIQTITIPLFLTFSMDEIAVSSWSTTAQILHAFLQYLLSIHSLYAHRLHFKTNYKWDVARCLVL